MGYRELTVVEVREILRRYRAGERLRAISRATGADRKTVREYVRVAQALGLEPGGGPLTPELVEAVGRQRRPGREPAPSEQREALLERQAQIRQWLFKGKLSLVKVQQFLVRDGLVVPYSTLRDFARAHCDFSRQAITVRLADPPPGEEVQADFGQLGLIWDPEQERRRLAHAFVLVLAYSRHMYVEVVFQQTLQVVIRCFENAWASFGGVVTYVIIDNMKPAVLKVDPLYPRLQPAFAEYAEYRDFLADPARRGHPKDKPRVERPVPYVRGNFFRGEKFLDIGDCNRRVLHWCRETAGMRCHGTTRRRPRLVFEEEERARLKPLAKGPFDIPAWGECKVHRDHHIRFQQALYSVPTRYIGFRVKVRADQKLVRVYKGTEVIKTHPKKPPGGRSTDHSDYPKELTPYTMRDPIYYIEQAHVRGPEVGHFLEQLLEGPFPWSKIRQAQKLLRLGEKYGRARLNAACTRARRFDLINVHAVERILKKALEGEEGPEVAAKTDPLPSRFLRPSSSFVHSSSPKEVSHGSKSRAEEGPQATEAGRGARHVARSGGDGQGGQALLPGVSGVDPE